MQDGLVSFSFSGLGLREGYFGGDLFAVSAVLDNRPSRGCEGVREVTGRPVIGLSPDEAERARQAGFEPAGEWLVGRDPRAMSTGELKALGHEAMSPMEAIRARCLDCCAGSAHEVRCCIAVACVSWPFRLGRNPWRAPPSFAQRESARRSIARMNAAAFGVGKMPSPSLEASTPAPE